MTAQLVESPHLTDADFPMPPGEWHVSATLTFREGTKKTTTGTIVIPPESRCCINHAAEHIASKIRKKHIRRNDIIGIQIDTIYVGQVIDVIADHGIGLPLIFKWN